MKFAALAMTILGTIAIVTSPAVAGKSALRFTTTQQVQMSADNNEVEELPPQENVATTYTTSYRHCCRPYLSHFYGLHVGHHYGGGYYYGPHFSYRSLFRSVDVSPGGIDVRGLFRGWSIGW